MNFLHIISPYTKVHFFVGKRILSAMALGPIWMALKNLLGKITAAKPLLDDAEKSAEGNLAATKPLLDGVDKVAV